MYMQQVCDFVVGTAQTITSKRKTGKTREDKEKDVRQSRTRDRQLYWKQHKTNGFIGMTATDPNPVRIQHNDRIDQR